MGRLSASLYRTDPLIKCFYVWIGSGHWTACTAAHVYPGWSPSLYYIFTPILRVSAGELLQLEHSIKFYYLYEYINLSACLYLIESNSLRFLNYRLDRKFNLINLGIL